MYRFDLLEQQPLTLARYFLGSAIAAVLFLLLWVVILAIAMPGMLIVVVGFPILVIVALCSLLRLHGWKRRVVGFLGWLMLWSVVFALGIGLLFGIVGGP